MDYKIPYISLILVFLISVVSCTNQATENIPVDKTVLTNELALYYYNLKVKGNTTAFVDGMLSCDSTPHTYKLRMKEMIQHHQKILKREKRGVDSIHVSRMTYNKCRDMAYVFLHISYKDKTQEEVIFPLVFSNNEWKIR